MTAFAIVVSVEGLFEVQKSIEKEGRNGFYYNPVQHLEMIPKEEQEPSFEVVGGLAVRLTDVSREEQDFLCDVHVQLPLVFEADELVVYLR